MTPMRVDNSATKRARDLHEDGVRRLNAIFGWTVATATDPRQSDPEFPGMERQRRRLANKRARASRKRNRGL